MGNPAPAGARVVVLDAGPLTAFARGGENLYVSPDTLDLPEGEAAAILGHERAHLLGRHLARASICADVASTLAAQATLSPALSAAIKQIGKLAEARLKREQEFQADAAGRRMLEGAAYEGSAMASVLRRLQKGEPAPPSPLDDHPPLAERLEALGAEGAQPRQG